MHLSVESTSKFENNTFPLYLNPYALGRVSKVIIHCSTAIATGFIFALPQGTITYNNLSLPPFSLSSRRFLPSLPLCLLRTYHETRIERKFVLEKTAFLYRLRYKGRSLSSKIKAESVNAFIISTGICLYCLSPSWFTSVSSC